MARFIHIGRSSIIDLDQISQAHFVDHPIEPTLNIDIGVKSFELSGAAARPMWERLLQSLAPEDWTVHHNGTQSE